ncbi:radical SAM protein [Desulfovibrio sulfodismutans]|uniref:Radical SAM protein n=1 Tax=Desulfolutivibrio sulfodismutans TaxID=63561 RepID=A0A7K3NI15_9BACT|nr:radical SAM protein [Desulfolutivibrio sulfodismutans]NDY55453.1 radical SAM protein [Desulfolutivibrio sulfodismutans]QLA12843.1 radical SAM protein [Desulfolutivibrio sulfodismutans DSM 3696]
MSFATATRGGDARSRLRILKRHAQAFVRHATLRRLGNFVLAEFERLIGREHVSSRPYLLKIEPSNICNMHCPYCHDGRSAPGPGQRPYGRMTLGQFARVLDDAAPWLFKINLYGFGEPFLFPETFDMIRLAADRNIGVGVSSNMQLADPGLAQRMVSSGLETLIVSIHGATQASCARFMGGGDLDLALGNVRAVIQARNEAGTALPFVDWQYCVTGFNAGEMDAARRLALDIGVDQIRFIRPFLPKSAPPDWSWSGFPPIDENAERQGCPWLWRAAYINWDGGVLPCCRDVRKTANDFGDAFDPGISRLWNNDRFRAARRLVAKGVDADDGTARMAGVMCAACPAVRGTRGRTRP